MVQGIKILFSTGNFNSTEMQKFEVDGCLGCNFFLIKNGFILVLSSLGIFLNGPILGMQSRNIGR